MTGCKPVFLRSRGDPFPRRLGDELRAVVGPDMDGNAAQDEEIGQDVDHVDCD
jgi:hypothetical protein